jgi:hypothetical protein
MTIAPALLAEGVIQVRSNRKRKMFDMFDISILCTIGRLATVESQNKMDRAGRACHGLIRHFPVGRRWGGWRGPQPIINREQKNGMKNHERTSRQN